MMLVRVATVLLAVLVATTEASPSTPQDSRSCRYWCRKPDNAVYCCDFGNFPPIPVPVPEHKGVCPEVRPCPGIKFSPQLCPHDGHCKRNEKCCYDSCLEHHACKLASNA
nr:type I crustin 109 [Rimicaris sp.]